MGRILILAVIGLMLALGGWDAAAKPGKGPKGRPQHVRKESPRPKQRAPAREHRRRPARTDEDERKETPEAPSPRGHAYGLCMQRVRNHCVARVEKVCEEQNWRADNPNRKCVNLARKRCQKKALKICKGRTPGAGKAGAQGKRTHARKG